MSIKQYSKTKIFLNKKSLCYNKFMKKFIIFFICFIFIIGISRPYVNYKLIEKITKKYGFFAKNRFLYQNKLLNNLQKAQIMKKLNEINLFYNQAKYMSDMALYHKMDYWATPYQFLGKDAGDCEDYAIAKYFALKYLNFDPKKLYFVYVRVKKNNIPHMVLAYFAKKNHPPLILDNLINKILPANLRTDLIPVYMFNPVILEKTLKNKNNGVYRKWDDLIKRIKKGVI